MSETKTTGLAPALVAAQVGASAVAKASRNEYHRYKYASAEAMISEAREALGAAGLALITMEWRFVPAAVDGPVSGRLQVVYRLYHSSGEYIGMECSTPVLPEKGRPQDKAEATALTYNLGYFLRGLLLLPREEEGANPDQRDDRNHEPRPPQRAPVPSPTTSAGHAPPAPAQPANGDACASLSARIAAATTLAELARLGGEIKNTPSLSGGQVAALRSAWSEQQTAIVARQRAGVEGAAP